MIALEEQYYSSAIFESISDKFRHALQAVSDLVNQLREIDNERLANMDCGHISWRRWPSYHAPMPPEAHAS